MSDGEKTFRDPEGIAINRVYTRKGDSGSTRLVGGQKIAKTDPRLDAYGQVDELNAFVGVARVSVEEAAQDVHRLGELSVILLRVQHELFNLGSALATLPEDLHPEQPQILPSHVEQLEREMDACNAELEPLRSFVLPGSVRVGADLHVCRTVCRRAERRCVAVPELSAAHAIAYLNRLSDAFFVWSRWATMVLGESEVLWDPNVGAAPTPD